MGVKRLDDLIAYQRAVAFKEAVYKVVAASARASRDLKYRSQVIDAASSVEGNIAEGWGRRNAGEMCQFLRDAVGSLFEAERRLLDGAARGYFQREECDEALREARRCLTATSRLAKSLEPFTKRPAARGNKVPISDTLRVARTRRAAELWDCRTAELLAFACFLGYVDTHMPPLSYASLFVLQALDQGHEFGFGIMDVTSLPSGTVYPALRRLEALGLVTSSWESEVVARRAGRPRRRTYRLSKTGKAHLVEAGTRFRAVAQLFPGSRKA